MTVGIHRSIKIYGFFKFLDLHKGNRNHKKKKNADNENNLLLLLKISIDFSKFINIWYYTYFYFKLSMHTVKNIGVTVDIYGPWIFF